MMNKGDNIVLKEPVIVTGSLGAEYLLKNTKGVLIGECDGLAEIQILDDIFFIPSDSIILGKHAA